MTNDERPIAAIATALAPAAIAAIRLSGDRTVELLAERFSRPSALRDADGHTMHHGSIVDDAGRPVDEVLVAVYRRPRSYTGEEAAEVFCHGSPAGARRVLAVLLAAGFDAAEPGEFTRRAFLNGKLDLTRAEAVNEIVGAQTATAHAFALERLAGGVEAAVRDVRSALVEAMAQLAVQLDYPEEETGPVEVDASRLGSAAARARDLAATYGRGRLFQEGARVAIAGRTNAGKSALFNRLLRHDRSIVSDVHGTTRDYVEALIDVDGIPVRLFDTAGLRAASEPVEEEGVRRSHGIIEGSDLVLYVVDAFSGATADDHERLAWIRARTPALLVLNKMDLASPPAAGGGDPAAVRVSALTAAGMDELNASVSTELLRAAGGEGTAGATVIDSERQHALLLRAAEAVERTVESLENGMPADVAAVDLQEALDAVGEITGEVASAEILDAMFGSFCVGK